MCIYLSIQGVSTWCSSNWKWRAWMCLIVYLSIPIYLYNSIYPSIYLGCQYLVFFYLNVEGWKVAAEQQLQALEREILKQVKTNFILCIVHILFWFQSIQSISCDRKQMEQNGVENYFNSELKDINQLNPV